jgi:hypothetical protein
VWGFGGAALRFRQGRSRRARPQVAAGVRSGDERSVAGARGAASLTPTRRCSWGEHRNRGFADPLAGTTVLLTSLSLTLVAVRVSR